MWQMQGRRNYDCAKNVKKKNKIEMTNVTHKKRLDDLPFWISKHWKFVWKWYSIVESCRGQASPIVSCSWGVPLLSHQIENVSLPLFENRIFWAKTTLLHQKSEERIWYFTISLFLKKVLNLPELLRWYFRIVSAIWIVQLACQLGVQIWHHIRKLQFRDQLASEDS